MPKQKQIPIQEVQVLQEQRTTISEKEIEIQPLPTLPEKSSKKEKLQDLLKIMQEMMKEEQLEAIQRPETTKMVPTKQMNIATCVRITQDATKAQFLLGNTVSWCMLAIVVMHL